MITQHDIITFTIRNLKKSSVQNSKLHLNVIQLKGSFGLIQQGDLLATKIGQQSTLLY